MHRDSEHLLGVLLPDDIVIQHLGNFARRRHPVAGLHQMRLVLLTDDIHAELDALVADEDGRTGDELAHLVLTLPAERAVQGGLGIAARGFGHGRFLLSSSSPGGAPPRSRQGSEPKPGQASIRPGYALEVV